MLQEQYRNEVPQELSALMELQQGMQTGKVAPTTPQGQPTVAAQMAGAAQQQMAPQMAPQMPMGSPAVNQVARQAGIAGQIQAMQQQRAMQQAQNPQAVAQMAAQMMQQQRPQMMAAGGVASLNPNIRGFKYGGIVGYAGDDESVAVDPGSTGGGMSLSPDVSLPFFSETIGSSGGVGQLQRQLTEAEMALGQAEARLQQYGLRQRSQDPEGFKEALSERDAAARRRNEVKGLFEQASRAQAQERRRLPDPAESQRARIDPSRLTPEEAAIYSRVQPAEPPSLAMMPIPEVRVAGEPSRPAAPTPRPNLGPDTTVSRSAQVKAGGPPTTGGLARSSQDYLDRMMAAAEYKPGLVTPEQALPDAYKQGEIRRQYLKNLGLDPDLQKTMVSQIEDLYGRRQATLSERERELVERAPTESRLQAMLGMRGRRFSDVVAAGAERGMAYDKATKQRIEQIQDLKLDIENLKIEKVNTANQLRQATAMGDWDRAMGLKQKLEDIETARQGKIFEGAKAGLQAVSPEARTAAELDMKAREINMRYRELQQNKDGQQLLAAQGRVTSAQELRQKAYEKAKPYLAMPEAEVNKDPMLKNMRNNALSELKDIEENVLTPAVEYRDALYEKVLQIPAPKKRPSESGGPVTVSTPKGTFTFPNQEAADKFKQDAGIK